MPLPNAGLEKYVRAMRQSRGSLRFSITSNFFAAFLQLLDFRNSVPGSQNSHFGARLRFHREKMQACYSSVYLR